MTDTTFQLLSEAEIDQIQAQCAMDRTSPRFMVAFAHAVIEAHEAKQREMDAKAEPASDLAQRCREIIKWQDTGILKGKALREFASKQRWADDVHALTIAERVTAREAFGFIASHPPAAQAREPMTDEQVFSISAPIFDGGNRHPRAELQLARAIERFHGITKKGGER